MDFRLAEQTLSAYSVALLSTVAESRPFCGSIIFKASLRKNSPVQKAATHQHFCRTDTSGDAGDIFSWEQCLCLCVPTQTYSTPEPILNVRVLWMCLKVPVLFHCWCCAFWRPCWLKTGVETQLLSIVGCVRCDFWSFRTPELAVATQQHVSGFFGSSVPVPVLFLRLVNKRLTTPRPKIETQQSLPLGTTTEVEVNSTARIKANKKEESTQKQIERLPNPCSGPVLSPI